MPHFVLRHRQSAKDPALTVSAWRLGGHIERQPCQLAARDLHTGHVKGRPGIAAQTRVIGKLPTGSGGRLARAAVELDPRPGGVAAPAARVTLAKNVFDFAPAQQVRLAVGVDAASDGKGGVALRPFAAARENCWGVFVDDWGRVSVRYDL